MNAATGEVLPTARLGSQGIRCIGPEGPFIAAFGTVLALSQMRHGHTRRMPPCQRPTMKGRNPRVLFGVSLGSQGKPNRGGIRHDLLVGLNNVAAVARLARAATPTPLRLG